jgi:hypothetical protein
VAQTFNLTADLLTTKTPDLTALSNLNDLSEQQLKQGILSSAFYALTISEAWSNGNIALDTLPFEEIFRDVTYFAETLSEQLSIEQSTYSEALSIITSESQAQTQTFENRSLTIIQQPRSLTVNEESSFSLRVQANSGDGELSYQWMKNNQDIPGANAANYGVARAMLSDAGSYSVNIMNNDIVLTSMNALISVSQLSSALSITEQPKALSLTAGDPVTLSVSVTGDGPYDYQWQKGGSILLDETNSTLHIAESLQTDSGTYRVTVSNGASEASSNFVDIIVNASIQPITINQHPSNLTITEGEVAAFHVNATGGGFLSYQWRKDSINIENAYSSEYELNSSDVGNTGNYDVIVTNSRGSLISSIARLTVLPSEPPVSITVQPISKSVLLTDRINLRTAATGGGALSYQWFLDGQIIAGANQAEYSVISAELVHQGSYTVRVSNQYSDEVSLAAFISIKAKPSVQLSWGIPEFREDGSPLDMNEINAYVLEYGYSPSIITGEVRLENASTTQHTFSNLEQGVLYIRIATIDSSDIQGKFSNWISIPIE